MGDFLKVSGLHTQEWPEPLVLELTVEVWKTSFSLGNERRVWGSTCSKDLNRPPSMQRDLQSVMSSAAIMTYDLPQRD